MSEMWLESGKFCIGHICKPQCQSLPTLFLQFWPRHLPPMHFAISNVASLSSLGGFLRRLIGVWVFVWCILLCTFGLLSVLEKDGGWSHKLNSNGFQLWSLQGHIKLCCTLWTLLSRCWINYIVLLSSSRAYFVLVLAWDGHLKLVKNIL